jgi:hypothetical protein
VCVCVCVCVCMHIYVQHSQKRCFRFNVNVHASGFNILMCVFFLPLDTIPTPSQSFFKFFSHAFNTFMPRHPIYTHPLGFLPLFFQSRSFPSLRESARARAARAYNSSNTHEHSNSFNTQDHSGRKETEKEKIKKSFFLVFLVEEANRAGHQMEIEGIGICSCYISWPALNKREWGQMQL